MTRMLLVATHLVALLLAGVALHAEEVLIEDPPPPPSPCSQVGSIDFGDPSPPGDSVLGWQTNGAYSSCHENWQLTEGRWVEFSFCGKLDLQVEFLADDTSCVNWPDTYSIETTINGQFDARSQLSGVDRLRISADNPLLSSGDNRVRCTVVGEVPETEGCYLDKAETY